MKNNKQFSNQIFTWSLDKSNQASISSSSSNSNSSNEDMSEAELFQLLLGEEAKLASLSGSESSDDMMTYKPPSSSTGKLDFRPVHEDVSETDIHAMSIKEKRQLRNKISARNFRNRRKEYISKVEDELTLQKNENVQLKLEIKWLKNKMEKMQKENDKLRLDLMVGGMFQQQQSPPQIMPQQQVTTTTTTSTAPAFFLDSTSLINSTFYSSNACSSDESTHSSPPNLLTEFPDNWDFVLPTDTNTDTYLSHALVPDWNINQVLSKETSHFTTAPNLFQKYPLLAPALMSIVISHTMTMSTDEILATTKLSPPPYTTRPNVKEAQATWDILEPLRQMKERNEKLAQKDEEEEEEAMVIDTKEMEEACSVRAFKQNVCRYLYQFVSNYMSAYQTEQNASQQDRFFLCRKFHRGVKNQHISA